MHRACLLVVLLLSSLQAYAHVVVDEIRLDASDVSDAPIRVRVLLPPGYVESPSRYPVVYVNDGQDLEGVGIEATLQALYAANEIEPLIVVAIDMPSDRMAGYGLFDRGARHSLPAQTKHGPVGLRAQAYAQWVTTTLVPTIDARYRTEASASHRAILGWSLGALSAFGIGWQYPELFGTAGAFSPSFWISADRSDADAIQATRLVHRLVDSSLPGPRPAVFLAAGTEEEANDRDGDGVIDVIDDARDLVDGWRAPDGRVRRGLRRQDESIDLRGDAKPAPAIAPVFVLVGGQHNQASWARMLPVFLRWAFASQVGSIDATDAVGSEHPQADKMSPR